MADFSAVSALHIKCKHVIEHKIKTGLITKPDLQKQTHPESSLLTLLTFAAELPGPLLRVT